MSFTQRNYFSNIKKFVPLTTAAAVLTASASLTPVAFAQEANPVQQATANVPATGSPVFRVEVVDRSIKALNYHHRGGATTIDFAGTALMPEASGEAKVESKQGYIEIEVEFDELSPALQYGPEYLTYVMWAITPEGRATNLGEVLLNGNRSKLDVTTELQSFGLMVTAEPYFAVSQPSDVVVLENIVRPDTEGKIEVVQAEYQLLKRGSYVLNAGDDQVVPRTLDPETPLEVYEAHNAIQLARIAGADTYASDTYQKALTDLRQSETYLENENNRKPAIALAREAVQTAEDARLISLREKAAEEREQERAAAAQETARANQQAQLAESRATAEANRRQAAEQEAQRLAAAKLEADQSRLAAERAQQQAEQARADAEAARQAAAREADRLAAEREQAEAARQAAEREAQLARNEAATAQQERAALRQQLQQQLNVVLETKQSARGLIVSMPDVLFDIDQATLKPEAREKLARVAGILLAHPDLELDLRAEGHTDSTGTDQYNQQLSEKRAAAVETYLVSQGIADQVIDSQGYGESTPIASNDTREGRQMNRRVELVIAGEAIAANR